ncbi:MAG: hypothetical protein HFACDABA_01100 [Anaerolineales bacterium]|nr:hypothetical protein [Anaerolineales bacterium]
MEILDIGTWELLLIIVLAFIIIGPHKAEETSRTLGRWLNRLFKSEAWRYIRSFSADLVNWPNKIAQQAGLEELDKELQADPALLDAAPQTISTRATDANAEKHAPPRSHAHPPHQPPRADEAQKKKAPAAKQSPKFVSKKKTAPASVKKPKGGGRRDA